MILHMVAPICVKEIVVIASDDGLVLNIASLGEMFNRCQSAKCILGTNTGVSKFQSKYENSHVRKYIWNVAAMCWHCKDLLTCQQVFFTSGRISNEG